ncbi:hypothetical protein N9242_02375 [Vicingaceae bacterium]|nr:hypothetical protein [Vicingaceae bacterium]
MYNIKKNISFLIGAILISFQSLLGANRYWVSASKSNWNISVNWASKSGGVSVQLATDDVFLIIMV